MKHVLLYCRSGFEKECAGEIQDKANNLEVFGFPPSEKNNRVTWCLSVSQDGDADKLIKLIDFKALIFARQMMAVSEALTDFRVKTVYRQF